MIQAATAYVRENALALRLRVSHLVESAAFEPAAVAPSAILLIRRLSDPLPRRLWSDPCALRPALEWERAAGSAIEDCYRSAARPARGPIPRSAEVVLFTDPGEMLACLALDLLNGDAATVWWWKAILRALPAGAVQALFAAWLRDARYVPAALAHLTHRGEAVRVLRALSPSQARSILLQLAREFELDLPAQRAAPFAAIEVLSPASVEPRLDGEPVRVRAQTGARAAGMLPAPWQPTIPAELVPESLGCDRATLLGVSLLLARAPELARGSQFANAFASWYQAAADGPQGMMTPAGSVASTHEASSAPPSEYPASRVQWAETERKSKGVPSRSSPGKPVSKISPDGGPDSDSPASRKIPFDDKKPSGREYDLRAAAGANDATDHPGEPAALPDRQPSLEAAIQFPPARIMPPSRHSQVSAEPAQEIGRTENPAVDSAEVALPLLPVTAAEAVQTELGGVLFLVNLLRVLRLPGVLQDDFGIEPPINGWALVELFGRCLLGPSREDLASDAMWAVLATLSGRSPAVPAAADFQGCACYRLPNAWSSHLGPGPIFGLGVRLRGRHLQLWHPAGIPVLDFLFDSSPSRSMVETMIGSCLGTGSRIGCISWRNPVRMTDRSGCCPLGMKPSAELRRFLAMLLPYLRWRLALGLGLDDRPAPALAEELLHRKGRLHVTATHVDLVMHLDAASGRVRRSGLDADPGWVPELGRVVKFHFI